MTDFHTFRIVMARKPHRCEQCRAPIDVGTSHYRAAQVLDGEFSAYREHFECHAAWSELNFDLRGIDPWEGAPFLRDDDHEEDDRAWMREAHPVVAERMGWP